MIYSGVEERKIMGHPNSTNYFRPLSKRNQPSKLRRALIQSVACPAAALRKTAIYINNNYAIDTHAHGS